MKRVLLMMFLGVISVMAFAQEADVEEADYYPGGQDRLILELNWNYLLDAPDVMEVKWYSRGINIYAMYDLPFGNSPISFAPGLGVSVNNFYHNGEFRVTDTIGTIFNPYSDTLEVNNNKLTTTYIDIPLELRYRSKPDGNNWSWKVALGFKAGYLISSHIKYVGEGNVFGKYEDKVKIKKHDLPNLNQFRYGTTLRIGYGPFNLVGFYSLSKLFDENLGPELTPISVGISFNGL